MRSNGKGNGNGRERGTVKWFNDARGYGFISRVDADDVFVHFSAIQQEDGRRKTLKEDQEVEFKVVSAEKGLQAIDVEILGASARA